MQKKYTAIGRISSIKYFQYSLSEEAILSSQFVADLYLALSQDRLEAYRPLGGTDLEMLTNYFWNIDLVEALVPSMHAVELALHNSLHNALTVHSGTDMWYYQPGVLESPSVINLGRALQEAAQKAFLGVSSWSIIGASNQLAEQ
jgi:hypothetical protein